MNTKGFTLIELIIVVAVVAIIGSVVVPMFSKDSTNHTSAPQNAVNVHTPQQQRFSCKGGILFEEDQPVVRNQNTVSC